MLDHRQSVISFRPEDTLKQRLKKAAHVVPGKEQLSWMDKEMTAFIHFGLNTFTGRQWGNGTETLLDYSPSALDPEQWVRVCAEAGLKHMICTLKHHDGFCLWHTRSTDFSVEHTKYPLDVAGALSEACRKYGVGFGVYLSPWDMHQREAGVWPTDAYNELFMLQLEELLTAYGPVEELWFDGACGDYPIWQKVPCYQPQKWYEVIHRLQPSAVYRMYDPYFFTDGEGWKRLLEGTGKLEWSAKAVRWVGNEEGRSREDEWSFQPVSEPMIAQNAVWPDLGNEKYYEHAVGAVWYPVEVNTTILNQWFWNPETSKVKSLRQLAETYRQSVGNNGVLLLNLSPDRTGRIPGEQIQRLMELRQYIDATYGHSLAEGAKIVVTDKKANPDHAERILTENQEEYWEAGPDWDMDRDTVSFDLLLPEAKTFDQVMLREHVRDGQRIAEWSFSVWENGIFREVVHKGAAGRKCIRCFEPVHSDRVRLTVRRSYDSPQISGFGLYLSRVTEDQEQNTGIDLTSYACPELPEGTRGGVCYRLFGGGRQSASEIHSDPEETGETGWMAALDPSLLPRTTDFHAELTGWMRVKQSGTYHFELGSADGALFFLANRLCLDNDEPHEWRSVRAVLRLAAGFYPYRLLYTSFRSEAAFTLHADTDCPGSLPKRVELL